MVQGDRIRIYNTKNIGVGRRGRTETYIECQSSILLSRMLAFMASFSSDALKDGGTIDDLLEESRVLQLILLIHCERIYDIVIPKPRWGFQKNAISQILQKIS